MAEQSPSAFAHQVLYCALIIAGADAHPCGGTLCIGVSSCSPGALLIPFLKVIVLILIVVSISKHCS